MIDYKQKNKMISEYSSKYYKYYIHNLNPFFIQIKYIFLHPLKKEKFLHKNADVA